jgi:hypothetical protein
MPGAWRGILCGDGLGYLWESFGRGCGDVFSTSLSFVRRSSGYRNRSCNNHPLILTTEAGIFESIPPFT